VGDPLTFRLETQRGSNLVTDIFAANCVARDPYSGRSVELIDRYGCPTDPNLFPGLDLARDGSGLEARFSAFKIPQSNYLMFECTVKPCRDRCRPATCAVNGREEISFGRRRRRSLPVNETDTLLGGEVTLPGDPDDEPVEPQDADLGPDLVPEESEEYVHRLLSVYYTRDEAIAEETPLAQTDVCISSGEYYGLLATMVVLMLLMLLGAGLAGIWFRRSRLVAYKNRDADMGSHVASPATTFSFLHGKRSTPLGSSFPQGTANPAYESGPSGRPEPRGRRHDDPSEPIYTDPSLFERSRSLRSVSASEFGQGQTREQQ